MNITIEQLQAALQQQNQHLANTINLYANNLYRQIESYISIQSTLNPALPLPPMRGWAISPDFGALLVSEILKSKPKIIIEIGSGVSTLLSAYCLNKIGNGKIVSLESDKAFASKTMEAIKNHGLEDLVDVIIAPLTDITLNGQSWQWYDITQLEIKEPADMLTIDGPRGDIQKNSRYPALAVFYKWLSDDAIILLDDAARQDEKNVVNMWKDEFPDLRHEFHNCEKGAAILRK